MRYTLSPFMAAVHLIVLVAACAGCGSGSSDEPAAMGTFSAGTANAATPDDAPVFGEDFWQHWGDGRAEMSAFDLTFPRYGEPRKGVAVAIFVTETFSNSARVKADPGVHPDSDEFPVMKLNLVEDFPTGIYDYNVMTSTFLALSPVNGRAAGRTTKVSFSAQEWCGHVYSQLLFDGATARRSLHSYFDREADQDEVLNVPVDALAADALLFWARDLAAPLLAPGESREVQLVRSLKTARVMHEPVVIETATLSRAPGSTRIEVPAGGFETSVRTVAIAGGPTWTVHVEIAEPRRIVSWSSTAGHRAELIASERIKYWELNREGGETALAKLGLTPRNRRSP